MVDREKGNISYFFPLLYFLMVILAQAKVMLARGINFFQICGDRQAIRAFRTHPVNEKRLAN